MLLQVMLELNEEQLAHLLDQFAVISKVCLFFLSTLISYQAHCVHTVPLSSFSQELTRRS